MAANREPPHTESVRPMRRDALRNRRRLLDAARVVYAEMGPDVGVDEIARRAGVGVGTLYRHFSTKDDLLDALLDELLEDIVRSVTRTAAQQPPGQGFEACLWFIGDEMASYRIYLGSLWSGFPPADDERRLQFWGLIERLLKDAQQSGEIREDLNLTDVFSCVLSIRALIDQTGGRVPEIWRRHLSVLLAGFRPSAQPLSPAAPDNSAVMTGILRRRRNPRS
ncbi:TetR/AcrR family transcriptional regulator [Nocardia sp. NPDC059195]|uniref:TetR/AcrR family transcriptional regulator n=1 Tax=Nocardia sp. NPDC059195 TaxID=3346765 RepID=UPI00367A8354